MAAIFNHLKIIIIIIFYYFKVNNTNKNFNNNAKIIKQHEHVETCLLKIFNKYLKENLIISPTYNYKKHDNIIDNTMTKKIFTWNISMMFCNISETSCYLNDYVLNKKTYVLEYDTLQEIRNVLSIPRHKQKWHQNSKFILIQTGNKTVSFEKVFKILWKENVANFIVIQSTNLQIYKWNAFRNNSCGDDFMQFEKITRCDQENLELFSKKYFRNYNGCLVKVVTVVWPPNVMAPQKKVRESDVYVFKKGLEIAVMNLISQKLNFTVEYRVSPRPMNWGIMYKFGNATGDMLTLKEEKVDVAISSLASTVEKIKFMDVSTSYLYDYVTICTAYKTNFTDPSLNQQNKIIEILLLVLIFSAAFTCVSKLQKRELKFFKKFLNNWSTIFAITLNFVIKTLPETTLIRLLILLWMLCCFYMTLTIAPKILENLIVKTESPQLENLTVAINLNYTFLMPFIYYRYFMHTENTELLYVKNNFKNCDVIESCLDEVLNKNNYAIVISNLYISNFLRKFKKKHPAPLLHCMQNYKVSYSIHMMMRKGFYMKESIDRVIQGVNEAGLMEHWKQFLDQQNDVKEEVVYSTSGLKFSFGQINGLLQIYLIGNLISFVVFLIEVVFSCCNNNCKLKLF